MQYILISWTRCQIWRHKLYHHFFYEKSFYIKLNRRYKDLKFYIKWHINLIILLATKNTMSLYMYIYVSFSFALPMHLLCVCYKLFYFNIQFEENILEAALFVIMKCFKEKSLYRLSNPVKVARVIAQVVSKCISSSTKISSTGEFLPLYII